MTAAIETFYRTAYADNIRLGAMQERSYLRESCDFEPSRGEYLMLDAYTSAASLTEVTTRNTANTSAEISRSRRRLAPQFWEFTEYFDRTDKVKLMRDLRPDSNWSKAVLAGFGTKMDLVIVTAMDAAAADEGGSAIAYSTTYDMDDSVGANTGMNVDKFLGGFANLAVQNVQDTVPWFAAIHPLQIQQLFSFTNDDRLLSGDFNDVKPLTGGKIGNYMGMQVIPTPQIPSETIDTNPGRYAYFYAMDSMVFSMDGNIEVHFDIIADKRHVLQVAHYATFSATRMHETKIVRAECATTAA